MKKETKTIAQQIKWNFETNGTLVIRNKNGSYIYFENSDGFWTKRKYDSQGNEIYWENSNGYWVKWKYDSQRKPIYCEDSYRYWSKWEYDSKGKEIYFENSNGIIIDNHPKSCEDKEIEIDGVKYKLVKA
jgi:hypothetical protein